MVKLKSIKKVRKIGTVSRKNPILGFPMQTQKSTQSLRSTDSEKKPNTVMEYVKTVAHYLKHYRKGMTIKMALDKSLPIDIKRSHEQLRAFYITGIKTGAFRFRVKASGLYEATSHEFDIQWDMEKLLQQRTTTKDMFLNTPIKFQCSCGRHTYSLRYIATKGGWGLGMQETRFPSRNSPSLRGIMCKHGIRVIEDLHKPAFQNTFKRWISNQEQNKRTNITFRDKSRIAGASFKSNPN